MQNLPHRLRALRRQNELSLDQLADKTGITKSYLSKLERGLNNPSISTVLKLAKAYDIGVGQLLGSADRETSGISLVRRADREVIRHEQSDVGYIYESMAGNRLVKDMEPFIVYPPLRGKHRPPMAPHAGEEFMFVLNGRVQISIGTKTFELEQGDSIYFDSELPHQVNDIGDVQAAILVVATRRK